MLSNAHGMSHTHSSHTPLLSHPLLTLPLLALDRWLLSNAVLGLGHFCGEKVVEGDPRHIVAGVGVWAR